MASQNIQFTPLEIKIVTHLFKHYNERYNARQLAKKLEINHAHANKLCHLLTRKQLLTKEEMGKAIYFSFNYQSKLALKFMDYLLGQEEFPKGLTILVHSLKKFIPYLQLGLVFGSSIKSKEYHDIDVLLVYRKDKTREIAKVKEEIRKSGLVERPLRYVDITEKDLTSNAVDTILYNILSDSLIFHNPEKYVEVIKKCHKSRVI